MDIYSAEINGVHMLREYGMPLENLHYVQPPTVIKKMVTVPGATAPLDMTETLTGYPIYETRTITMSFGAVKQRSLWPAIYSEIQNRFHNRRVQVVFDDDNRYYYEGRAKVGSYERMRMMGKLVIEVDADPYKYERYTSLEDWLWDPFSFVDGVIREYRDIVVSGTSSVRIVGSPMPVIPVIIASAEMTVTINGQEYQLKPGSNKLYGAVLLDQEYDFTFAGEGTASIDYRGGSL